MAERLVLWLLAVSAAVVGLWAQVAPTSFHADFPGFGRSWVAPTGPFNEHLIRDVGSLELALALVTVTAAVAGSATLVRVAAAAWVVSAVPHLVYHSLNLQPFGPLDAVGNVASLGLLVVAPVWLLLRRRPTAAPRRGLDRGMAR